MINVRTLTLVTLLIAAHSTYGYTRTIKNNTDQTVFITLYENDRAQQSILFFDKKFEPGETKVSNSTKRLDYVGASNLNQSFKIAGKQQKRNNTIIVTDDTVTVR